MAEHQTNSDRLKDRRNACRAPWYLKALAELVREGVQAAIIAFTFTQPDLAEQGGRAPLCGLWAEQPYIVPANEITLNHSV